MKKHMSAKAFLIEGFPRNKEQIEAFNKCVSKKDSKPKIICFLHFILDTYFRVGSHVVSVRIHCTEKWRTSFHTDVLSKSK